MKPVCVASLLLAMGCQQILGIDEGHPRANDGGASAGGGGAGTAGEGGTAGAGGDDPVCTATALDAKSEGDLEGQSFSAVAFGASGLAMVGGSYHGGMPTLPPTMDFLGEGFLATLSLDAAGVQVKGRAVPLWGDGTQTVRDVAIDKADNFYALVEFDDVLDVGGTVIDHVGTMSAAVLAFADDGQLLWYLPLCTDGTLALHAIAANPDGDPLGPSWVVGRYSTNVGTIGPGGTCQVFHSSGPATGLILKIAPDSTAVPTVGDDLILASTLAADVLDIEVAAHDPRRGVTELAVAGHFGGNATFDGVSYTATGISDAFVARIASTSTLELTGLTRFAGTTSSSEGTAVHVIGGDIYTAGTFTAPLSEPGELTPRGLSDAFVARLDPQGDPVWMRSIGSPDTGLDSLSLTDDGCAIVAGGHFTGTELTLETTTHHVDTSGNGLLVGLSPAGTYRFSWVVDASGGSTALAVAGLAGRLLVADQIGGATAQLEDGLGQSFTLAPDPAGQAMVALFGP